MEPHDTARVTISVNAAPERACAAFTQEIDRWWQRGQRFRNGGAAASTMHLESGVGGRFVELVGEGSSAREVELGVITQWDPPRGLAMRWRNANFASHEWTFLEISFVPQGECTRVTLQHRGWAALRADHPARHGQQAARFIEHMGRWWGDLLGAYRAHASDAA